MSDRRTVLVVGDESDVPLLCHACLESEGYEVVAAADAGEAMDRIRERQPDAIVLDVASAPTGVRELPSALARDPELSTIPVLALTSATVDTPRAQAGAWDEVVTDQLVRPPSPLLLSQAIEDALATSAPDAMHRRRRIRDMPELSSGH